MLGRCPSEQRCPGCHHILIHRGTRGRDESASELGQAVHDLLPREFTWIDVDGAVWRRSIRLLRILELKSRGQKREFSQLEFLRLMAGIIRHVKECPAGVEQFRLHPDSGTFLWECDPEEGGWLGESRITTLSANDEQEIWIPTDELDAYLWIGRLEEQWRDRVKQKLDRRTRRLETPRRDWDLRGTESTRSPGSQALKEKARAATDNPDFLRWKKSLGLDA